MNAKKPQARNSDFVLKTPKQELQDLFAGEEVVAFRPKFARRFGIEAALFIAQAIYWQVHVGPENWFYKRRDAEREEGVQGKILPPSTSSKQSWEWELALPRRSQELARRKLRDAGLLEEKYRGIPRQLYYRVNLEAAAEFIRTDCQSVKSALKDGQEPPARESSPTNKADSSTQLSHRLGKDHSKTISSSSNAAAEKEMVIIKNAEDARRHQALLSTYGQNLVTLAVEGVVSAGRRAFVSNIENFLRSGIHGSTVQASAEDRKFADAGAAIFGFSASDIGGHIFDGDGVRLD